MLPAVDADFIAGWLFATTRYCRFNSEVYYLAIQSTVVWSGFLFLLFCIFTSFACFILFMLGGNQSKLIFARIKKINALINFPLQVMSPMSSSFCCRNHLYFHLMSFTIIIVKSLFIALIKGRPAHGALLNKLSGLKWCS